MTLSRLQPKFASAFTKSRTWVGALAKMNDSPLHSLALLHSSLLPIDMAQARFASSSRTLVCEEDNDCQGYPTQSYEKQKVAWIHLTTPWLIESCLSGPLRPTEKTRWPKLHKKWAANHKVALSATCSVF